MSLLRVTLELPVDAKLLNGSLEHTDLISDLEKLLPRYLETIHGAPLESSLKLAFTKGRYMESAIFRKWREDTE